MSGVEIHGPFAAERVRVVVLFARAAGGRYAYGHAAGRTLPEAKRRALIEMCRHQLALERWDKSNPIQSNPIQSNPIQSNPGEFSARTRAGLERVGDNRITAGQQNVIRVGRSGLGGHRSVMGTSRITVGRTIGVTRANRATLT